MEQFEDSRIIVTSGDITRYEVDAVVNAANSTLLGGGGVDGAIHRAGGPAILEACKKIRADQYPDGLPTGLAVVTTAGAMPARYVIHTVGPVWHGGSKGERDLLASAYRNSLAAAETHELKTVAFPAVSTGVYGFPKAAAASIAFHTVAAFLREHELPQMAYLVYFSPGDMETALKSIRAKAGE